MKIAYIGIDLFYPLLDSLGEYAEIVKIFSCRTDNITEFNTQITEYARRGIPITYSRITKEDMMELIAMGCNRAICAGYYYIIPVIEEFSICNVHPALLPKGRGPWNMPIDILRGHKTVGLTFHRMTKGLDEGPIIYQKEFSMDEDENLESLTDKMNYYAREFLPRLIADWDRLWEAATPQDESLAEYLPEPEEREMTITPDTVSKEGYLIFRAFRGYYCYYKADNLKIQFISGKTLEFQEVNTDMKDRIDSINRLSGRKSSAYSFGSLFLWAESMGITIHLEESGYICRFGLRGEHCYMFPQGSAEEKLRLVMCILSGDYEAEFAFVTEEDKAFLETYLGGWFELTENKGDSEYVYDRAGFEAMSGGKYATLRKKVHHFANNYSFETRELAGCSVEDLKCVNRQWLENKINSGDINPVNNASAIGRYLKHYDIIQGKGMVFYIDGKPIGVVAGFPVCRDMYDCFLSFTSEDIMGMTVYMYKYFFESLEDDFVYINQEEDLGIEGIRKFKTEMNPDYMIVMYDAIKK